MNRWLACVCLLAGCASAPPDAALVVRPPQAAAQRRPATSVAELKARLLELKGVEADGELKPLPDAPVFVEFAGSPRLTAIVAQDLQARGVKVAASREAAAGVLRLSGRVQLDGPIGRRYFGIGETFEKIAAQDPEAARVGEGAEAVAPVRDAALAQGWYRVGLFDRFLRDYFSAVALTDALGISGRLNTLIAGDPRGFCLTNCEHWKHTHHTVILFANWQAGEASWKGHVLVKAWMEQIDPQPVIDLAYETLVSEHLLRKGP